MRVVVDVVCTQPKRPPAGSPVLVQVRDTSVADAPATVIADAEGVVAQTGGTHLATVTVLLSRAVRGATVRVHIDVDRSGRVSAGDFVSTASHPIGDGAEVRIQVPVRPV